MRVEKGVDLLLEEVLLKGAKELFGLGQGQPEMLDALVLFVEGDDIGDGLGLWDRICPSPCGTPTANRVIPFRTTSLESSTGLVQEY
jgi:hypothetical protein